MRPYWAMRDRLTVDDDLIVCGPRLVIPHRMRSDVLNRLHESHQGIQQTTMRARQTIYWPNIDNDIANIVRSCRLCREHLQTLQKEPMMADPPPSRVFQSVSTDYFYHDGRSHLVYVDRLSGWPIVRDCARDATSRHLVSALRDTFSSTGVPSVLHSDGGPQFAAKRTRGSRR